MGVKGKQDRGWMNRLSFVSLILFYLKTKLTTKIHGERLMKKTKPDAKRKEEKRRKVAQRKENSALKKIDKGGKNKAA